MKKLVTCSWTANGGFRISPHMAETGTGTSQQVQGGANLGDTIRGDGLTDRTRVERH